MTQAEKDNPKLLNASRKKRVAAGSGTSVQEVNRVLKMHRQMADMMKKLGKGGMKNLMGGLGGGLGGGLPGELPKDIGQMPDLGKIGLGQSGGGLPPDLLKGLGAPKKK